MLIEIDIEKSGLSYLTAGNLYIFPKNSKKDIDFILSRCVEDITGDHWFNFRQEGEGSIRRWPFPTPI